MQGNGKLVGHTALIAGACGDFGLETAKLLAAEGCRLHLADLDDTVLEQIAEDIADEFDMEPEIFSTDLSDAINVAALALECEEINILINSLGSVPEGGIETLDAENWAAGFELRVFGAINLTREVLEDMNELGSGIIINVGCIIGEDDENRLCQQTANAALNAFAENLDKQTKRHGIRVLTFMPKANNSAKENAAALVQVVLGKLSS